MGTHDPEVRLGKPHPPIRDVSSDITDQHNSIFFAAVSATRMPMIVTDPRRPDNPIIYANPAFLQMTGYSLEDMLGRNCRFLQGPETDPETVQELRDAVAQRRETAVEILNYKKSGASFWNALFMSPVFDERGELIYYFGSQLDVSRRRDAEDALRQSQKLEAVGQLTGGIAHDFNNLLTVILGFADLMQSQLERKGELDPAKARQAVDAIKHASQRGADLTQQLLAFSRKQKLSGRVTDVPALIARLVPLLRRAVPGIEVAAVIKEEVCTARLDQVQVETALLNLVVNARDAMPDGGAITIETTMAEIADGDGFAELQPGPYVVIAVTDTGEGMTPDIIKRVTEPFFTTKAEGKGTGLGLSMVYGFMKQSGGALRIYSEPGVGSTFRLYFPCDGGDDQEAKVVRASPDLGGRETILLVEDQTDVGDYAQAVLEDFGYTVIRADNAGQALAMLDHPGKVDLLFTDLIMPGGMNGVMLAREVRRRRPNMKILLTTGYAESSIERVDARGAEFDVINKPYLRSALASIVRRILDGPTGVG